jgi:hypothetical protein
VGRVSVPWLRPALAIGLAVVSVTGCLVELGHHGVGPAAPETVVALLSLSYEANVPTWYSSVLLLGCAFLLALNAADATRHRRHWVVLAAVFAYMSLDEVATLHEQLNEVFDLGDGVLRYGWILPAAALVLALGVAYLPFLKALDAVSRRRFLVAGAVYVGGALLMELPLGWWASRYGEESLGYVLIDVVEETLELAGASLFLLALQLRLEGRRAS